MAHIVASVGEVLGPVAFSSLTATRTWLNGATAALHAGLPQGTRVGGTAPAAEIAQAEQALFPT